MTLRGIVERMVQVRKAAHSVPLAFGPSGVWTCGGNNGITDGAVVTWPK